VIVGTVGTVDTVGTFDTLPSDIVKTKKTCLVIVEIALAPDILKVF
jgi:hypothetical protein